MNGYNNFKIKIRSGDDALTILKLYGGYLKLDCNLYKGEFYYYTYTSQDILKNSGLLEII